VDFVDADGNIIIPKAVRPILGLEETILGNKKGAKKQYRHGNLHIRDYGSHYTVHMDRVDPRESPLGHLLVDAPEYLVAAAAAAMAGRHIGKITYKKRREDGISAMGAAVDAIITGCLAGSAAGRIAYAAACAAKKVK
jgi:hypothetical protein